jgi:hypothetical protein
MPGRCHGGACCGGHGMDDQAGADGAALDGERDEQCADGAAASRTTGAPGSQALASQAPASQAQASQAPASQAQASQAPASQAQASQAQASRRLGHAGERGRDGGRIIL